MTFRRVLPWLLPFVLLAAPPAAASAGGGAGAPTGGGGSAYGETAPTDQAPATQPERPRERRRRHERRERRTSRRGAVVVSRFDVGRPRLFLYGRPARLTFRIAGRARSVSVTLSVRQAATGTVAARIPLGERPTNVAQSFFLTGSEAGVLPQGSYAVRISARAAHGRRVGRGASTSSARQIEFVHHRFPLVGLFSYGGPDGRFGAPRPGHTHQGQDLPAAEGTPVVAPRGGTVKTVAYQARGAGNYVVLHGESEDSDYVFMHLRSGSVVVQEGQRVRTGQRLGDVGSTGESSGAHLHFEVWTGGGWYSGGHPIDPLPLLREWDRWS